MMNIIKQLLTGKDGETHDIARWGGALSGAVGLGLQIYVVVVKGQPFDLQQFGIGAGALLAGVGASLKLKETTEP